jgi:PAS domain S-box-containing protein
MMDDIETAERSQAESLYRNIQLTTELMPVAAVLLSEAGHSVNYANSAFLKLFNKKILLSDTGFETDIFPDLQHPLVQQVVGAALQSGVAVDVKGVEINILTDNGIEQKQLDFYAAPITDSKGKPASGVLLTILDVTHEKAAGESADENERSYRSLMESMAVAVYTCDTEGKVNFYNEAAVVLWGRAPELGVELWCGSHKMYTLEGDWMPHDQCPAAVSLKEMRAVKAEAMVQRPNGNMRHVLVFPRPEYNFKGEVIGLINAVIDITERKALERQKDDFMGMVAHELKTPVTSIKGYAQILMKQMQKLEAGKFTDIYGRIENQLNNLTSLIDRMLNAAKIESGKLEFKSDKVDLKALVTEIVNDVQLATKSHQLYLQVDGDSLISGDRELLQQVIINLLSNAIKYSPKSDKIDISVFQQDDEVFFTVQDFGLGVPPDHIENIFEKFYRVKTTNVNRFPGIGLGLYLSAEIVRQQGGKIWAESVINEGSKFSFSFRSI